MPASLIKNIVMTILIQSHNNARRGRHMPSFTKKHWQHLIGKSGIPQERIGCRITPSDKDFIQLSDGDQVVVYDPIALTFKKDVNVETYMKVHILKAGDDNIANISKGKKIEKLLRELDSNLATDHAFKANYEFNRTLIDFNCIPEDVFSAIEDAANSCSFNYNCMELLTVFSKFRLVQMAEKVGKFKLPDASVPPPAKASESVKRAIQGSLEDFF